LPPRRKPQHPLSRKEEMKPIAENGVVKLADTSRSEESRDLASADERTRSISVFDDADAIFHCEGHEPGRYEST